MYVRKKPKVLSVSFAVRPQAAGRWRARAASRRWRRAPLAAGSWDNRAWACSINSGRRRRRAGVLKGSSAWASNSKRHSSASASKGELFIPWALFSIGWRLSLPMGRRSSRPDWRDSRSDCRASSRWKRRSCTGRGSGQVSELVLQLGDIRSNGNHRVFALWKRGNMPPPLAEGCGLRSFFFAAPKKNEPKRRGPRAGKELGLWPQTAFPEAGDAEKQHLPNHQNKWFIQTNRPQITFPEAGNLDYILYAFIKGSRRGCRVSWNLSSGHIFIHIIAGEEGYLTREKLSERSEFFSRSEAPFFW